MSSTDRAEAGLLVSWAAGADLLEEPVVPGRTHRMPLRLSAGGGGLRLRLSNAFGTAPLTLGPVTLAPRGPGAALAHGGGHPVRFAGAPDVTVAPGAHAVSDPVSGLVLEDRCEVTVSVHVREGSGPATGHKVATATSYLAPGDRSAEESGAAFGEVTTARHYLDAVLVDAPAGAGTLVLLGDSITDGSASTPDTDRRWPDHLAARLHAAGSALRGLANVGISGNMVLLDGAGVSALKRLERDVLGQPGLRTVFLFEGVNDIKAVPAPTAAQLLDGLLSIAERCRAAGARVVVATILPYQGWPAWTPAGEAVRQEVNAFLRENGAVPGGRAPFDAVVDFDAALSDPAEPQWLAPAWDCGDHLHPGDAGMELLARTVDLALLEG